MQAKTLAIVILLAHTLTSSFASIRNTSSTTRPPQTFCVCVPYYQCDSDDIVITNGNGLIDVKYLRAEDPETIEECEDYLEVCCRLGNASATESVVTSQTTCGIRRFDILQYVPRLDADAAESGEFPWMVTIFRTTRNKDKELKIYLCQGTLIHPQVVLTAAQCVHCLGNASQPLLIRAGQFDTMMTSEEWMYQEEYVQKVVVHKKYNPQRLSKNVALLILKRPVTLGNLVDITCLADHTDVIDEDKCLVVGWDKFVSPEEAHTQRSQVNIMKRRIEPYVSSASCTNALRKTPLGKRYKLDSSFVCAGGSSRKNFCSREIGGPLACPLRNKTNRYVQVGIASWCISSGNLQTPSMYASVLQVRGWIDTQVAKAHLETSVYRANTQT